MTRHLLLLTLSLSACSSPKSPVTDDFSSLAGLDDKSDAFSTHMKLVGSLDYGDTSASVSYSNPPKYRAFKFGGAVGDTVDIWVRSSNGGDAVAWLLDNSFKTLAQNDDADDTTLDSHITATLPGNKDASVITYYIVFRDYWEDSAKFKVSLAGKPVDFFACKTTADCVAVPLAGCCNNGYKIAVNKGEVKAYDAANACTNPHPICPEFIINDTRVAECDASTHECEMVACPPYQHYDSTKLACVDNPHCGGIAGIACTNAAYPTCSDDPRDSCDPSKGGADCPGICE
jgi:hypothetical protein